MARPLLVLPRARTRFAVGGLALALAMTVAACGGGGNGASASAGGSQSASGSPDYGSFASSIKSLYAAAKQAGETQVVIYGATVESNKPIYDEFTKQFPGITVGGQQAFGPQLVSRVHGEVASGKHVGDLTDTGNTTTLQFQSEGLYQPTGIDVSSVDPEYVGSDGMFFADTLSPFVIIYNTTKLDKKDYPKNWHSILDPKYKGQMVITDPTINGPSMDVFANMIHDGRYTQDFVDKFAATQPHLVASPPLAEQQVATGQSAIGWPDTLVSAEQAKAKGAPIGIVFPMDDGTLFGPTYAALLKGAPHPNAAKLLLEWELSPAGQKAIAANHTYSAVKGAPAPNGYPTREKIDTLKIIPLSEVIQADAAQVAADKKSFGR